MERIDGSDRESESESVSREVAWQRTTKVQRSDGHQGSVTTNLLKSLNSCPLPKI
jgi:hypothetical protein